MGEATDKFIKDCEDHIIEKIDKDAFAEVGKCYRLELYKAGYILCWTVFAESLRNKIKQLSDLGYNPAINEHTRIEKLERDHRSADVQIIDSAKTCELISDTEHTICRQVWTKRCLFAHPYGTHATEIDIRDIIEKTILYSMARPVFLTKTMIEERLDNYINHPHNVPDNGLEDNEIDSFLKLILPKNHNTLFQALFYRIRVRHENQRYDDVFRFLLRMCRKHIIDNNLDLNDKVYRLDKGISDYPDTTLLVVSVPMIWLSLSEAKQKALIKYFSTNRIQKILLYSVRNLLKDGVTEPDNIAETYYTKIKESSLHNAMLLYLDYDIMLDDIWDKYIRECQFSEQAKFIDFLSDNVGQLSIFSNSQLQRLGTFTGFCCSIGTFRAQSFVRSGSSKWFGCTEFVAGVAEECLKSRDRKTLVFGAWDYGLRALRRLQMIDKEAATEAVLDLKNTPFDIEDIRYRKDNLMASVDNIFSGESLKEIHDALAGLLNC